jgi:ABC-type glutathione transport system ATPase component
VLCLDEPTAGIAQRESEAMGPLLVEVRRQLGASVLIIEHDMPLIMGISDRVYWLQLGKVIAAGDPVLVRNDPAVIASHLGAPTNAPSNAAEPDPRDDAARSDLGRPDQTWRPAPGRCTRVTTTTKCKEGEMPIGLDRRTHQDADIEQLTPAVFFGDFSRASPRRTVTSWPRPSTSDR